ncbi:hypothetical protein PR202_ga28913 [Eleusine coracana subsp. coracana]|uniref:PH domain-containing protein n=1 Tax=Eleusine coracana subsp. coracana TaxID=191504 RepID=A0AAV5DK07_ELECO|nr:hypothetical protein PR202_ga28913 [Eleusine coracana subsp. coracana]
MLSSSASRREASRMAKSGELPKTAGLFWKDVAATARSGELSKAVAAVREAAAVHQEGWMVRYGRRKLGRSFFHTRYFVLESRLLAYYKKKPKDNMVPLKSLLIDGNCRVEDRGLKTHHGQQPDSKTGKHRKAFATMDFDNENGGQFSFSDRDSAAEEEDERPTLTRRTTIGNGPPDSVHDWTNEAEFGVSNQNDPNQLSSKKNWRLLRCQNGKSVFLSLGLREYFSQTDETHITPRIPAMESMVDAGSAQKDPKLQEVDSKTKPSEGQADNRNMGTIDEESDDDEDYQVPEANIKEDPNKSDNEDKHTDEPPEKNDLSCFSGILHRDTDEKSRSCWTVPDSKSFKVRSKNFAHDKSKIPAASYLMELAAIDWFKDTKRMDNVARQKGCVAQVLCLLVSELE